MNSTIFSFYCSFICKNSFSSDNIINKTKNISNFDSSQIQLKHFSKGVGKVISNQQSIKKEKKKKKLFQKIMYDWFEMW